MTGFHLALPSDILNVLAGLLLQKASESREAAACQRSFLHSQGVVLSHHQNKVFHGLRQRKNFIILPLGFRRSSLDEKAVGEECGIGAVRARQGLYALQKALRASSFQLISSSAAMTAQFAAVCQMFPRRARGILQEAR